MSKQRIASLIISIIALVLPIAGNLYSIHLFAFPAFSFASFKGIFTVPVVIISVISIFLSLIYRDENICLALIVINIILCIIPYSCVVISKNIPYEALIISYTENSDDYLVIDEYETDFINREIILEAFPDENDENVGLVSYEYKYFTNIYNVLTINATFSCSREYYPVLFKRLKDLGFVKDDCSDCVARYITDYSLSHESIAVRFNDDGTIVYDCYCCND